MKSCGHPEEMKKRLAKSEKAAIRKRNDDPEKGDVSVKKGDKRRWKLRHHPTNLRNGGRMTRVNESSRNPIKTLKITYTPNGGAPFLATST